VIFDKNIAFKKSKDLLMESIDEEVPVFEEVTREEEESNHGDEGPSESIKPVVIPKTRNIPNCLKYTLLDVEGHGAAKDKFRGSKKPKIFSGYATYMKKLIEV